MVDKNLFESYSVVVVSIGGDHGKHDSDRNRCCIAVIIEVATLLTTTCYLTSICVGDIDLCEILCKSLVLRNLIAVNLDE